MHLFSLFLYTDYPIKKIAAHVDKRGPGKNWRPADLEIPREIQVLLT